MVRQGRRRRARRRETDRNDCCSEETPHPVPDSFARLAAKRGSLTSSGPRVPHGTGLALLEHILRGMGYSCYLPAQRGRTAGIIGHVTGHRRDRFQAARALVLGLVVVAVFTGGVGDAVA